MAARAAGSAKGNRTRASACRPASASFKRLSAGCTEAVGAAVTSTGIRIAQKPKQETCARPEAQTATSATTTMSMRSRPSAFQG
ncbi:MAG: hypothetical protein EA355_10145 [Rhodobacteraceae bacterium]|nr:MAG: hypothetical protein EA355_10145 [Paracoccaceae bacterium]